jgi:hypothetical protein
MKQQGAPQPDRRGEVPGAHGPQVAGHNIHERAVCAETEKSTIRCHAKELQYLNSCIKNVSSRRCKLLK